MLPRARGHGHIGGRPRARDSLCHYSINLLMLTERLGHHTSIGRPGAACVGRSVLRNRLGGGGAVLVPVGPRWIQGV